MCHGHAKPIGTETLNRKVYGPQRGNVIVRQSSYHVIPQKKCLSKEKLDRGRETLGDCCLVPGVGFFFFPWLHRTANRFKPSRIGPMFGGEWSPI